MIADGARIDEKTIERNESCYSGKERQQPKEYDAGSNRKQPILLDLFVGAQEDILPAAPWDLPRRRCPSASAGFVRPGRIGGLARGLHAAAAERRFVPHAASMLKPSRLPRCRAPGDGDR